VLTECLLGPHIVWVTGRAIAPRTIATPCGVRFVVVISFRCQISIIIVCSTAQKYPLKLKVES
jgi:hypothetical protein